MTDRGYEDPRSIFSERNRRKAGTRSHKEILDGIKKKEGKMKHALEYSKLTIKCTNTGKYAIIRQTESGRFLSELFNKRNKRIHWFIDDDFETIVIRSRVWVQRIWDSEYLKQTKQVDWPW